MSVNIKTFGGMIERIMDNLTDTFGYAYFIMKIHNNDLETADRWGSAKGLARLEDPIGTRLSDANVLMTENHRVEAGSTSKTITAVAALKLLADRGISVDSPIYPFLPHDWKLPLGSRARKLTFRHLLEHTSALPEENLNGEHVSIHADSLLPPGPFANSFDTITSALPGALYKSMKVTLEMGPQRDVPDPEGRLYRNINYALFRIIIPYIKNHPLKMKLALIKSREIEAAFANLLPPKFRPDPDDAPVGFKVFLGSEYVAYVRDHVLSPAGILNADVFVANPLIAALHYYEDDPVLAGTVGPPEPLLLCGGTGWKLSAKNLCMFAAKLVTDGYSDEIWDKMRIPSPRFDPKHINIMGLSWPDFPPPPGVFPKHAGKSGSYKDEDNKTGNRAGWRVFTSDNEQTTVVAALVTNFNSEIRYDAYQTLETAHELASFEEVFPFEDFF